MAEGLSRATGPTGWEYKSAGVTPAGVQENTVKSMNAIGVDISNQFSKRVEAGKGDENKFYTGPGSPGLVCGYKYLLRNHLRADMGVIFHQYTPVLTSISDMVKFPVDTMRTYRVKKLILKGCE